MTRTLPRLFLGDIGGIANSIFSPIKLKDAYLNKSWVMTGMEDRQYVPTKDASEDVSDSYNTMMSQAMKYNIYLKEVIQAHMGFKEESYIFDAIRTFENFPGTMETSSDSVMHKVPHVEAFVNYAVIIHKSIPELSKDVEEVENLFLKNIWHTGMNYIKVDAIIGDLLYMKGVLHYYNGYRFIEMEKYPPSTKCNYVCMFDLFGAVYNASLVSSFDLGYVSLANNLTRMYGDFDWTNYNPVIEEEIQDGDEVTINIIEGLNLGNELIHSREKQQKTYKAIFPLVSPNIVWE